MRVLSNPLLLKWFNAFMRLSSPVRSSLGRKCDTDLRLPLHGECHAGQVYLVGAGSGDAELLTLKAARLLMQADAVVYDRLVGDDVLALIPNGSERYYVGKARGHHSVPQAEIGELMVKLAREGKSLARKDETLVFYMGLSKVSAICHGLRQAGLPDEWPIMLVANASQPEQQSLVGSLEDMPEKLAAHPLPSPCLIVVGSVVQRVATSPVELAAVSRSSEGAR